jgi:hypothetical protein
MLILPLQFQGILNPCLHLRFLPASLTPDFMVSKLLPGYVCNLPRQDSEGILIAKWTYCFFASLKVKALV